MVNLIFALFILWLIIVGGLLLAWRKDLRALWKEPMLHKPVLIIESDDWGPGPLEQAPALQRIKAILERYQDNKGKHPVMTVAVILAIPDAEAIRKTGSYHRLELQDSRFKPILEVLNEGVSSGVFSLQLHGMEHYWPEVLMKSRDPAVQEWLQQEELQLTEALPPPLQSRWVDASELPSRALDPDSINNAVKEETALFALCFGKPASVAVPTTFIWDANVERAWAKEGISIVITPGRRHGCRDASGLPGCTEGPIRNLEPGAGVRYLVRNDYFEPEMGHKAERALTAIDRKFELGRPCLLETHRSNFLGARAEYSFRELDRLLEKAVEAFPAIRFMATTELASAMSKPDNTLLLQSFAARLHCWRKRLQDLPRFYKAARLTGLLAVIAAFEYIIGPAAGKAR